MQLSERLMIRVRPEMRKLIQERAQLMSKQTGIYVSESDVIRKYLHDGLKKKG